MEISKAFTGVKTLYIISSLLTGFSWETLILQIACGLAIAHEFAARKQNSAPFPQQRNYSEQLRGIVLIVSDLHIYPRFQLTRR